MTVASAEDMAAAGKEIVDTLGRYHPTVVSGLIHLAMIIGTGIAMMGRKGVSRKAIAEACVKAMVEASGAPAEIMGDIRGETPCDRPH